MTFKILSCDGGGIRGLITALLIQDLDTRSQIISKADGFAGTSTGGLLALALANGVPIAQIVNMYETQGAEIFEENSWWTARKDALAEGVSTLAGPGIFVCQYVSTGLEKVAEQLLGSQTLSSVQRFVAVNSARLWNPDVKSWEPSTLSNGKSNVYREVSLVDAALATSAAPTYFPPHAIAGFGYFADGGVFANNPTVVGVAEALANGLVSDLGSLRVLSLGTGTSPAGLSQTEIGDPLEWGASKWLWPAQSHGVPAEALLGLTMDSTALLAARQAEQILGDRYKRGNFVLSEPVALDDYKQVGLLESETNAYMKTAQWQAVRQWVGQNWQ
ncbi:patatin-like phospholipase family protein [Paraburkholderia jirisanensis]